MLGLGSNSGPPREGNKDTFAIEAQIIRVLETAGTPKKGLILCVPEPLGPRGCEGEGERGPAALPCCLVFQSPTKQQTFSAVGTLIGEEFLLQK